MNGTGSIKFKSDGSTYEGIWIENALVEGFFEKSTSSYTITYSGKFKNFNFHGDNGLKKIVATSYVEIQQGEFFSDTLLHGEEVTTYEGGIVVKNYIQNGEVINTVRNDRNYYDQNDITGADEYVELLLRYEGNENSGKTYFVNMNVGDSEGDWVFDSGAQITSIGKRMFERLKSEGITYRDLNLNVKTFGVGGISNGNLVIIDNVQIGSYSINNFIFKVSTDNNYSLMGIDFLDKFSNVVWDKKQNSLKFYK